MNKIRKLALVIPSLNAGGMERVITVLANQFITLNDLEIHLVILSNKNDFYKLDKRIIVHKPSILINGKLNFFKLFIFLRKKIKMINPDSILSFGEMYNSFVIISLIGLKIPLFVSDRSNPMKNWGLIQNTLRKILYPLTTGIISQTNAAKSIIGQITNHKNITVIGNPFVIPQKIEYKRKANIILSVGRLIKSKQQNHLIEIFNLLPKNDWELHFVGDGPEFQNLLQLSKDLGISNRVVFHGNQTDLAKFYSQSKIFATTTNSEGFPNVIGEAMSYSLAIISYNFVAGASDLIDNYKSGVLIELNNKILFVEELYKLMNSNELISQFGAAAFDKIKKYNVDNVANIYLKTLFTDEKKVK